MFKRKLKEDNNTRLYWVAGHRARDLPEPFPNSEVKPCSVPGVSVVFGHVKPGKLAAHSITFIYCMRMTTRVKRVNQPFLWMTL